MKSSKSQSFKVIIMILITKSVCGLPVPLHSEKTVELAVFIDEYLYHHWLKTIASTSSTPVSTYAMQNFASAYVNVLLKSLNLIYAHPSLGSSGSLLRRSSSSENDGGRFMPLIGFHLSHTQLFWRRDPTNLHPDLRETAPNYLESFCEFAQNENRNKADGGTRWDHALLLTGVDLKFPNGTNYSVAGISWDNSMCNNTYSCSVVEGKTFRSVMTAAHEIGHSLGIEHDGLKYNFKCSPRGYIMSHAGGGEDDGKIAWSPCSKHNLRAFLNTAPSVLSNQVECLHDTRWGTGRGRKGRGKFDNDVDELDSFMPGDVFTPKEQCRLGGGKLWKPSTRRRHVQKICWMLHCNNTATGEIIPLHPALEGTPCGDGRICQYGECLPLSDSHPSLPNPKTPDETRQLLVTTSSVTSNFQSSLWRWLQAAREKLGFSSK